MNKPPAKSQTKQLCQNAARDDLVGPDGDRNVRTRRPAEIMARHAIELLDRADLLDIKSGYYEDFINPPPVDSIDNARALSRRIRAELARLNAEVPGLDIIEATLRKDRPA